MLLDGAALTEATQATSDAELQTQTPPPEDTETSPDTQSVTQTETPIAPSDEPSFALSENPAGQIIVIDASVSNADELQADIPPEWTVIRLDAGSDGLTQLAQALQGQSDLTAIHLFSHGGEGHLQLGATNLNVNNLDTHAALLRQIGQHLSATGDLMIYGCDVAESFMGQQFVNDLARITGADVAASDDATGNILMGGDWQLEYSTGDTVDAFDAASYVGLLPDSYTVTIGQNSGRLYYQASGTGEGVNWDLPNNQFWTDFYTTDRTVPYWGSEWRSVTYPVPRWGWLPWTNETRWFQVPVERTANYGTGTRYGTTSFTIANDSTYELVVSADAQYKYSIPDGKVVTLSNSDVVGLNLALYKGTFNPTKPLENLVSASQGQPIDGWFFPIRVGANNLYRGELDPGSYTLVVSYDGRNIFPDNNIWWSTGNNYAEQLWGNYTLNVTNLNRAPVWTTRDLDMTMDGSGVQTAQIPWSLAGNQTVVDLDGDNLTITATLSDGTSPLPSWLSFNANSLTFTGNPPANTAPITVRLHANDGQVTSTRDFVLRFANDNDQPVLAVPVQDLTWDGSGNFTWDVPAGTFTDADPGAGTFTYTAKLTDGSNLPSWLSMSSSGTLSGNPPANFANLEIRITANDGTGQGNATQTDVMVLRLVNNNDVPTVSAVPKTVNEDSTLNFSATDFIYTDTDTRATNDTTVGSGKTLQSIRIVSLPAKGTLWLDANGNNVLDAGEVVAVNQTVTAANLARLRYTPAKDWAGGVTTGGAATDLSASPDSFQWTATDGVNEAVTPATTSITVNLINDAPVLTFSEGRTLSVRPNTGQELGSVVVDPGLSLFDADAAYTSNTQFDGITKVTLGIVDKVTGNFVSGDQLSVTAAHGITASYNTTLGVLTLTAAAGARASAFQDVLRTLTFSSSNTTNDNLREISIQLQVTDVGSMSFATFDGVNDYIDTMEGSLPVGGDFTVSVWAQIDANVANGQYIILGQGNSADNFFIGLNKGSFGWQLRLGNNWAIDNAFPSDGKWHQYTITRTGTTGTVYIDGIKVGNTNGTTSLMEASLPATSLRIGNIYRQNDTQEWAWHFWKGGISDVRVYNRVITSSEITASLDTAAGLTGYEPNLVAWYPLKDSLNNQAAGFNWSLGRDFNPLNGDGTDGPWSLGVMTGNAANSGNFNWGSFQAFTTSNSEYSFSVDTSGGADYVQLEHTDAKYWNTTTGWSRFLFPNGFDGNAESFTPGAVTVLPGYVNPAAMQFTAPVAGVYAIDARFWDGHNTTPSAPSYKVFKVNAAGTIGTEISPGPLQIANTSGPDAPNARSAVQQVVLAAGERLVFAIHKGDGGDVSGDEIRASIDMSLIATAVQSGGQTWYYNHATGRYIGLSATTATWDAAKAAAGTVTVAGQTGYLASATDPTSLNIYRALMRESGQISVFAGGTQLATATDNASTAYRDGWFWSSGPKAGQLFDGLWQTGEPNSSEQDVLAIHAPLVNNSRQYHLAGFDDGTASSSYRYLIEFGDAPLAAPAELNAALSANVDPGNALVFVDSTTAYSARTGHYYKITNNSSGSFEAQQQAASSSTYAGQSGYLAQATTADELDVISRLARLTNSSGVWVGLKDVDITGTGVMDWKWINANGTVASSLNSSLYYQEAESTLALEAAGWKRVAYDGFSHGYSGWNWDTQNTGVRIEDEALGRYSNEGNGWVKKDFDLSNKQTLVTFDFQRIDSWDNENFMVRFRPDRFNYNFVDITLPNLNVGTLYTSPISGTANITYGGITATIKYTITPLLDYGNYAHVSNYKDQTFRFEIELPDNFADTVWMYFGSTLDSHLSDEAWKVDNLSFWQKGWPSTPGVGGTLDTFENNERIGWGGYLGTGNSLFNSNIYNLTVPDKGSTTALWTGSAQPRKTFYIGNEATRIEFDMYALDSWDNELFRTYLNDTTLIEFRRVHNFNYTDTVTGSAVINGKNVSYTLTPNSDHSNWSGSATGHWDQSFRVVIDLPAGFGESTELKFGAFLDQGMNDESLAIDNVRVYSLEGAGWLDPYTGVLKSTIQGANLQTLYEYGPDGAALAAPLLTTTTVIRPDIFVNDTRQVLVRVGNTAPTVSNWGATLAEDNSLSFSAAQFISAFTDPESDTLASITLTSVPDATTAGVLKLGTATLTSGTTLAAGDLDKLRFEPLANYHGTATFSYTASDGNLSSTTAATVTLTVTPVNDAPVLNAAESPTLTAIAEDVSDADNTGRLVSAIVVDTSITDVDVTTAPKAIAVTSVNNTHGVWQYQLAGSSTWVAFTSTTGKNVDLGSAARLLSANDSVRFVPTANYHGTSTFTFRAWDQSSGTAGGTLNPNVLGGTTVISSASDTASITITPLNDAPTTANKTLTIDEDSTYVFTLTDFPFSDIDVVAGVSDQLQAVVIATLPTLGSLTRNNGTSDVAVTAGQSVSRADIVAGKLKFTPVADAFGSSYSSFTFRVNDGSDDSLAASTITFDVTDTNDAPTSISWVAGGGSVLENADPGASPAVVVGKLTAVDPNTGDTLRFSRVSNSNFNVAADGTVTLSSLASLDYERNPTQTLTVRVTDSGGLSYDQNITVTIGDVEETGPSLITQSLYVAKSTLNQTSTVTVTSANLKGSDAQQSAAQLKYTVRESVQGGTFWIDADGDNVLDSGEELSVYDAQANPNARDTFTQADVDDDLLRFTKDNTQVSGRLSVTLSDGTESVSGMLMAITSSPPVANPVDDQVWATTGAQTFQLPGNAFTDPDFDALDLSAQIWNGSAWEALTSSSWLSFNASTWTFSGTPPAGTQDGSSISLKVTATDGRTTPASDEFNITFKAALTQPAVTNPIQQLIFDGHGVKSYTFASDTFTPRAGNPITGYTATLASDADLPYWLELNHDSVTGALTLSGNPPADASPGPLNIKLTALTATGGSSSTSSTSFELFVLNANDQPTPTTTLPNQTITDAQEYTYTVNRSTHFTDGDGDAMSLSARLANNQELPSWIRFAYDATTGQGTFIVKAPAGSGTVNVRVVAQDIYGGEGNQDFTITYSGGSNEAPSVQTSAGISTMDGRGQLNTNALMKLELVSVSQQGTVTITDKHLKELDPDDDGAGLTYTITQAPTKGLLWLDTDGDGTLNGSEVALGAGSTFTQADIDDGKLKYQNTDSTTAQGANPPDDSFVFNLKDGGENDAQEVKGVLFNIQVTPKPAAPALVSVLRATPSTETTGDDTLTFKVVFSENVRGVDASDFMVTGSTATVQSVLAGSGSTYYVKVSGGDLASLNGTVGLALATTPTVTRSTDSTALNTATAPSSETYTVRNVAPTVTIAAPTLHKQAAFYITLDFSEAVNDLTLSDISASSGATLSNLQRISTAAGSDPDNAPAGYNPLDPTAPTIEGNRYRVRVTPTGAGDITLGLAAGSFYNNAGNGNTAATSVTVVRNSLPVVKLDAAATTPAANRAGTFTEVAGADDGSAAVAFTSDGFSLADINTSQKLAYLRVSVPTAQITEGTEERLLVAGATPGGSYALNFSSGQAQTALTLGGITYTVQATVTGADSTLSFSKADGTEMTFAQAEALVDALRYNHTGDNPTAANRAFSVVVNDGMEDSAAAVFTVTVVPTNDAPVISVGTGDAATAALTETNTNLKTSGTLSVLDRDLAQTVTVSKAGVTASGTRGTFGVTDDATLLAMLTANNGAAEPSANIIGSDTTTGTLYWAFNSGTTAFDYLAVGETLTLTYTVRATDSNGTPASDDQTITIIIEGSNDKPVITGTAVTSTSSGATMTAAGTITVSDPDTADRLNGSKGTASITATTSGGSPIELHADSIAAIGSALNLTTAAPAGNPGDLVWSFSLSPGALKDSSGDALASGDKILISYPITVAERTTATALTVQKDLRFTVVMTSGTAGNLVIPGDTGTITEGSPSTLRDADSLTFQDVTTITSVGSTLKSVSPSSLVAAASAQETAIKNAFSAAIASDGKSISWVYNISEPNLDFLKAGDTVTAVFTVTVNGGPTARDVTITITGTNDAPVISSSVADATGSVVAAGTTVRTTPVTATGTLTRTDADRNDTPTWAATGTGVYGSFSIDETTGEWTYTLVDTRAATKALPAGETKVETFTVSVTDSSSAVATQVVRVTVTGANDAPTLDVLDDEDAIISDGVIGIFTDDIGNETFTDINGTLSGADVDPADTKSFAITGQSADLSLPGFTHSKAGSFGMLYLNALSGAYRYVPDDAKIEAATSSTSDAFTVTVTDAAGASASQALSVTIAGANDTPTIALGSASATLTEANSALSASGQLQVGDLDVAQTVTASVSLESKAGVTTGLLANDAGLAAMFKLNGLAAPSTAPVTVLSSTEAAKALSWAFASGSEAFNYLRQGDTLTLTYTITVNDGTATALQDVVITINGTNDAPVISVGAGNSATGALLETNNANLTTSGTLTLTELEPADTVTLSKSGVTVRNTSTANPSAIPSNAALLAMLSLSTVSGSTDITTISETFTWTFDSGSATFDGLAAGETLILDYTIRATDNAGSPLSDVQTVTVTITGANDAVNSTAVDVSGAIASGFPEQMFDKGSITFTDLDLSDRPTASFVRQSITGTSRTGALTLSDAQKTIIEQGFSIAAANTNNNGGRIDWNYALRQTDIDFLGSGQNVTAVFRVTVNDGKGSTSFQDVTVTIAGKNIRPVFSLAAGDAHTASLTEGDAGLTVSDTITITDTNLTDTVTVSLVPGSVVSDNLVGSTARLNTGAARALTATEMTWLNFGAGSAPWTVLSDTQSSRAVTWTFNSGSEAFNDLAAGDTLVLRYQVQATDNADVPASNLVAQYITITITGTNDGPVVTSTAAVQAGSVLEAGNNTDGTVTAGTPSVSETLTVSDADRNASIVWSVPSATSTTYGSFTLAANGTWTYTLDNTKLATQRLAQGDTVVETFTVRATDDQGVHVDQTVSVTIQGANDKPDFIAARSLLNPSVREDGQTGQGQALPGVPTVSGTARATDVDTGTVLAWSLQTSATTDYGSLALNTATGAWTYTLNNSAAATQALNEGDSITDSFTVRVADQFGAFKDQVVSILVEGANDAPVMTHAASAAQGAVTEAGVTTQGAAMAGTPTTRGTLTVNDVDDENASLVWSVQGTPSTTYGSFALATDGSWTYTLDNSKAATQALIAGQQVIESFTVRATDSLGAYATQAVNVQITGSNDAPTWDVIADNTIDESIDASAQDLNLSGTVSFGDVDLDERVTITYANDSNVVWSGGTMDPALAAKLLAGLSTGITTSAVPGSMGWQYQVASADLDFLGEGQTITFSYTLTARDSTGNDGFASAPFVFTVGADTTPPAAPTVASIVSQSITPVIYGTAQLQAGDRLSVTVNGATYDQVAVNAQGLWQINTGTAVVSLGTLAAFANGTTYEVVATVTDAAGNPAVDVSTNELQINSAAPLVPVVNTVTDDSYTSSVVLTVVSGTTTDTLSMTGPAGSKVDVLVDGAVVGTATESSSGNFSFTRSPAIDPLRYSVRASFDRLSGSTIADSLPTLNLTGPTGAIIDIFENGNLLGTASAGSVAGSYSFTPPTPLGEGRHVLSARTTVGGVSSGDSQFFVMVIDTQPPSAPVVDALTSHSLTPVLTGVATLGQGDRLSVTLGSATWSVDVSPNGRWTLDTAQQAPTTGARPVLQTGQTYSVVATVTDAMGRSISDASSGELIIDTSLADTMAPAAPRVLGAVEGGSNLLNNGFSSTGQPVFNLLAEPGSTVRVFNGETFLGTAVESTTTPGSFSFRSATALAAGTHSITFRATDALGATTPATLSFTINGTNDVPTVSGSLAAGAYLQGESFTLATAQLFNDIDVNSGVFTFSANTPPGLRIDPATGIISGAGTRPGDYTVVIRATDAQGAWAETVWEVRINAPAQSGDAAGGSKKAPQTPGDDGSGAGGNTTRNSSGDTSGVIRIPGNEIPGFTTTIPVPDLQPPTSGSPDTASNTAGNTITLVPEAPASTSGESASSDPTSAATVSPDRAPQQETARTEANVGADGQLQVTTAPTGSDTPATQEVQRSSADRIDVTIGANGQVRMQQRAAEGNQASSGIILVEVQQQQGSLQIEIADFRRNQVAQYRATLPDGNPLPESIKVDPASGRVSIESGKSTGLIRLQLIAQDTNGSLRTLEITIDLDAKPGNSNAPAAQAPAEARLAFAQQLASHQQQWAGYGDQLLSVFTE